MTQRNSLFVLLGIFLALIVLVVLQSNRSTNETPTPEAESGGLPNRLFPWGVEAMQAFSIRDPYTGATLSFQRNNDDVWESVEMPEAIPDQAGVDQMGLTLAVLPVLETLDQIKEEDYAQFGLTQTDAFLILISLLKNGEQHTVIIGDVASGNVSHYALVDDRAGVYVLDARPIAYLVSVMKQIYEPTPVSTQEATLEPTP